VEGGNGQLVSALAEGLDIRYGHAAETVEVKDASAAPGAALGNGSGEGGSPGTPQGTGTGTAHQGVVPGAGGGQEVGCGWW